MKARFTALCLLGGLAAWAAEVPDTGASKMTYAAVRGDGFEGVIVPAERAPDFWKDATGLDAEGAWTPGSSAITELEAALPAFLKSAPPERSPELWKKLPDYKRQYVGLLIKGHKTIYANYFCRASGDSDWTKAPVLVDDGGDCYFQVQYDVESKAFSDLQVNGEG